MFAGHGVTFLRFDEALAPPRLCTHVPAEWLDCTDLRGTHGFCDPSTARILAERLARRRYRGVTFIGSGAYHYVTYLLLREIQDPFALVLFDHHTDMAVGPSSASDLNPAFAFDPAAGPATALEPHTWLHCGNWVRAALQNLPALQRVVIVGARREDEARRLDPRVTVIWEEELGASGMPVAALWQRVRRVLRGWPIYVSIDKDVLAPADAMTDWDAGSMRLVALTAWLRRLITKYPLVGLDVCGEWPAAPSELWQPHVRTAVLHNERANQAILAAVKAG
ncbi:hypothetical protein GCM10010885_06840 [Alicyclobacillus cellulosilyticus]|uniref:Arginase family protein n=1 Tax=Alicyclobacillus cellulosilyticus TaxID=1003997 RepID=A0A917K420_9BACL|nr:arginase family protein [Alicyclobacillus cellulosilyticus]GGJ00244.1 hypothetical protein GCM10010885_06840 [Alicyclobacillus cellulosilyticus]